MVRKKIPEVHYRTSRICRILGNSTAYEILHLLKNNMMKPEELAKEMGLSVSTVSMVLRSLRQFDLIRDIVKWKKRIYWIKDETVLDVINHLEKLLRKMKFREH